MLGLIFGLWLLNLVLRAIVVVLFMTGVGVVLLFIPVIVPVWRAARRFQTHEHRAMTRGEGWLFALIFSLLTGLSLTLLVGVFRIFGAALAVNLVEILTEDVVFVVTSVGVYGLVLVALNRLILWLSEQFNKRPT
ncbi:MAG: ABZJ_00895 family protein [Octadecabacter sp.]